MDLSYFLVLCFVLVLALFAFVTFRKSAKNSKRTPPKTYKREFILSFENKYTDKPLNFCNVNTVIKNQEAQMITRNSNPKQEKPKMRIKGLSKGDDRLNRKDDSSDFAFKIKTDNSLNRNILNPSEKENLNILLGFILTKLSEDEKKSKEDHNFSKLRNYEIIYVPQKQQSFEKENEELEKILTNVYDVEKLKEAITCFTNMITNKKSVSSANYHKLAKLSLKYELLQWVGFFIKEMQKHKIDIQREILDDFLNLSYVVKTMTNLDSKPHRKNNSFELPESQSKKKTMVYKKENDWVLNKEEELKNVQNIWEKFKSLNVNAESFIPTSLKNKSMKFESESFVPKK